MQKTLPPIVINQSYYRGTVQQIFEFPNKIDPETLSDKLIDRTMMSSKNGKHIAAIVDRPKHKCLETNIFVQAQVVLSDEYKGKPISHRILMVKPDEIIFYGLPINSEYPGIFVLQKTGLKLLFRLEQLVRVEETPTKNGLCVIGKVDETQDELQMYYQHGSLSVDQLLDIRTLENGALLILEKIGSNTIYYTLEKNGFGELNDVRLKGKRAKMIVPYKQSMVMALQDGHRTSLVSHPEIYSIMPHLEQQGIIEQVWTSFNQESIAVLVRKFGTTLQRQLWFNGNRLIEDQFEMERGDLQFTKDGAQVGARILIELDRQHPRHGLLTKNGLKCTYNGVIREFLLDCEGNELAVILDNGHFCKPIVQDRPHDSVALAWNLCVDGQHVAFNHVVSNRIYRVVDQMTTV